MCRGLYISTGGLLSDATVNRTPDRNDRPVHSESIQVGENPCALTPTRSRRISNDRSDDEVMFLRVLGADNNPKGYSPFTNSANIID